jgi:hypothetical protein
VQRQIRIDDAHQRDLRKIQALGDHLCADEDVDLLPFHRAENAMMTPLGGRGIQVHSRDPGRGESLAEEGLDLLCPHTSRRLDRMPT